MARVCEYKRSVDAVTSEGHNDKSQFKFGDVTMIHIKEEPCNTSAEETRVFQNDENSKHISVNMSDHTYYKKKTPCHLTTKEREDSAPDKTPKNTSVNDKRVCSSKKRKNRKRKRHERHSLVDRNDCKNMEGLHESDDVFQPYKRPRRSSVNKKFLKKKTVANCNICFLSFTSRISLNRHSLYYEKKKLKPFINVCVTKSKYSCNFCSQTFKDKRLLQSHLFHLHALDLIIDVKKNSLPSKSNNSHSDIPTKQAMRQTTLFEYMFSPVKSKYSEIVNNLNNTYLHSQVLIKQEIDLNDNESDLSMNTLPFDTSLQNEIPSQGTIPNQPFVKIHIHSTAMKVLLGIDQGDSTEPSETDSQNNKNSDEVHALKSLNSSENLNNKERSTISKKIESVYMGKTLRNRNLLSMCKKCSVTLIRCDDKLKTKLTSQFNLHRTPSTENLGQNNCTSEKGKRRQLRVRSTTVTPTVYSTRNTIPKDSSSPNSIPKGLPRSSFPSSKLTMLDFPAVNHLNEQIINQQSLHERIAPSVEENISLEKTNVTDPKALPSDEELNLTNIENTLPTTKPKLKILKVSLIKLPIIKKELDTSNIIHCEICDLPFTSKKRKDKHIKRVHTMYISSICTVRFKSKRCLLKHYIKEHCDRGYNRCCVCYKFYRSRLSLHQHLVLHCIKVILPKNDEGLNRAVKCSAISKRHKRFNCSRSNSVKHKKISDIGEENVNVNNIGNIVNQTDECKANNAKGVNLTDNEQNEYQINEMRNSLEDNVIFLSSDDYEEIEPKKELLSDPLNVMNDSLISDNETGVTSTPDPNTVPLTASNNKSLVMVSNIANTKNKYPCSICGKQFQKLEGLWQHKRTYTQSMQNFCTTCGLCFSNRKILRNHVSSTHDIYVTGLYKYHCQFCNQGFRSETNLRIHELHYHAAMETTGKQKVAELIRVSNFEKNMNISQTMCSVCGRNFDSYERYRLHCMYYHKGHVFACHFCDQIFQGLYMLHHHNKSHHYPESTKLSYTYHCRICYEGFTLESHFHGHMAHVHSDKQHLVSSNIASTSAKKSYVCSKCHLEFSTIMELMVHVEHYTDGGKYECQQCPRKCCTLAVLNEHINLSHGDRLANNYKCSTCNEVLISSTSLLCHNKHVHQYVENSVDFTYSRRSSDQNSDVTEINIHDEVLPVSAESDRESIAPDDSLVPMNTFIPHTSIWGKCNISCPICGLNFGTDLYLKKHLTEYLDVGDYKCETCDRRFANYEFLEKHKANHVKQGTPLTKYYCSVCNENFQSSIVYESHIAHLHARIVMADIASS